MARDTFKAAPVASIKALDNADDPGTFEAIVSVFGNVDSDGEVVTAGAFTKTLAAGPKPIVYSHDWMAVPIGQTIVAQERPEGLYVKGRLFVGPDEDHAKAREVYAAMRAGALAEFSWGGKVTVETVRENDDGSITVELNEIDLVEYGPCLKGSNPATRLVAIKSMCEAGLIDRDAVAKTLALDTEGTQAPEAGDTGEEVAPDDGAQQGDAEGDHATDVLSISDVRSLLDLPADAPRTAVLDTLRDRVTSPPAPSDGGGDTEQRDQVAELLLP